MHCPHHKSGLPQSGAAKLLVRVRKIVTFFHRSARATAIHTATAKPVCRLKLSSHKLIQDVSTSWNSLYDMLARFLEQQPAVIATLMSRDLRKGEINTLKEVDVANIEDIVKLMAPLKVATTLLAKTERAS